MQDKPVIESLLDIDFYKLSMGQMIFHKHPNVPVVFSFINRTKNVRLAEIINVDHLKEHLIHCQTLRFSPDDLHYIMGTYEYGSPVFSLDYINFLKGLSLPRFEITVTDGQFDIIFYGPWSSVTYWETLVMSIVNELYYRALVKEYSRFEYDIVESKGRIILEDKIIELLQNPKITFSEFGTRRRFSKKWQDYLISVLAEEHLSQFKGTSNVLFAKKYGLKPIGTNAHEIPMVYSGIFYEKDLSYSQHQVLVDWETEYGLKFSIFLPDTFGSNWFFSDVLSKNQLSTWKGSRQDSGDPLKYAEKIIELYNNFGIDSNQKLIVFADSLDMRRMKEISSKLDNRIGYTFGWGTDLSNDMGFEKISIVTKVISAAGNPVVKLSDDITKATGHPNEIMRIRSLVGYKNDSM